MAGDTVLVYRPGVVQYDRHGDPVANGEVVRPMSPSTYIGTLDDVVFGELTVESLERGTDTNTAGGNPAARGNVAMSEGLVGFPRNAPITVQHGDYVVTELGAAYSIVGPRLWDRAKHPDR